MVSAERRVPWHVSFAMTASGAPAPDYAPKRRPIVLAGLGLAAAAALVGAWYLLPLAEWSTAFGAWARGMGTAGVALICAAYVLGTLLCVPGWPLTLLVALAYGWWAILLAIGCGMIAALIAFLAGRTIARRPVERLIERHPKVKAIDGVAREETFKTILLARLTPVTPFAVENYFFGVTGVHLSGYLAATFVGIIPGTILNVWVGVIGRTAASGEASAASWAFLIVGLVAGAALVWWMPRAARKRLKSGEG
jgi:uncharacterized membrane protein YdjX (TVP38/TMEM64 family)